MNFFIPGQEVKLEIKESILNVKIKRSGIVNGKNRRLRIKIKP